MIYKNEKRELEKPFWLKEIKKKWNIETKSEKQTRAFKTVKMEKKQIVTSKLLWKWFHLNDYKITTQSEKIILPDLEVIIQKGIWFPNTKRSYLPISYL